MKTRRVLVVEDEFLIRLSLSEALAEAGFVVTEAETADAALPLIQADPSFDLLVTDIQLPGELDGSALARAARDLQPALPVLFMTGCLPPGLTQSPYDVYVSKPYSLDEICHVARRLLDGAYA